jgi:ribulose-phosphate 3-epimerase
MAKPVDTLVDEFIVAGANAITIHPATANNPKATLNKIKSHNISAGLAINPTEPLDKFFALHAQINQLLIMTVEPGFSGQKFIDSTVAKIKQAAKFIYENNLPIRLCVDGGVDLNNIAMLKQAGCNTFIAGSSIFNKKEKNSNPYAHIISQFKLNLRG